MKYITSTADPGFSGFYQKLLLSKVGRLKRIGISRENHKFYYILLRNKSSTTAIFTLEGDYYIFCTSEVRGSTLMVSKGNTHWNKVPKAMVRSSWLFYGNISWRLKVNIGSIRLSNNGGTNETLMYSVLYSPEFLMISYRKSLWKRNFVELK